MTSSNNQDTGFTLLEMLAVLLVAGVLITLAAPSLLSLNKPLRDGVNAFTTHINLVRSKAMASGKAHRIKPKYTSASLYPNSVPNQFVVEYANNCQAAEGTNAWQPVAQFDLDLPEQVGMTKRGILNLSDPISGTVNITNANSLNWNICFDSRGIIANPPNNLVLQDYQAGSKASLARIELNKVGVNDVYTYSINAGNSTITWIPKQDPSNSNTNCILVANAGKCTRNVF